MNRLNTVIQMFKIWKIISFKFIQTVKPTNDPVCIMKTFISLLERKGDSPWFK